MKQSPSTARRQYEHAYRQLRRYGEQFLNENVWTKFTDERDCAILSYDNRDRYLFGWVNVQRWRIWQDRIYNRWPEREYPF